MVGWFADGGISGGAIGGGGAALGFLVIGEAPLSVVTNQSVLLHRVIFRNNTGGHENGVAPSGSGAISLAFGVDDGSLFNTTVTVLDSVFDGNSGGSGSNVISPNCGLGSAALQLSVYSHRERGNNMLVVRNTNFTGNTAPHNLQDANAHAAGAINFYDLFTTPLARSFAKYTAQVVIENCRFINNSGAAGAVSIALASSPTATPDNTDTASQPALVTVSGSHFESNSAACDSCRGGALLLIDCRSAVYANTFVNNSAGVGGSILYDNSGGSITQCSFRSNRALINSDISSRNSPGSLSIGDRTTIEMTVPEAGPSESIFSVGVDLPRDLVFYNETVLKCPPGYTVFGGSGRFGCQFCQSNTYDLSGGVWVDDGSIFKSICQPCSFGSVCSGGNLVSASNGYWSAVTTSSYTGLSSGQTLSVSSFVPFTACSAGHCCAHDDACAFDTSLQSSSDSASDSVSSSDSSDQTSLIVNSDSICSGNRAGVLCVECASGYSETFGGSTSSPACRLSSDCNDGGWIFAIAMVIGISLALGFFYTQTGTGTGRLSVIVYFYQLLPLVSVSLPSAEVTQPIAASLSSLFKLQFSFTSGDGSESGLNVCPIPGLTGLQTQILWMFGVPALVLVPLVVIALLFRCGFSLDRYVARFVAAADAASSPDSPVAKKRVAVQMAQYSVLSRFAVAAIRTFLYTFAIITSSLFTLLSCTTVVLPTGDGNGGTSRESVLVIAPSVKCYTDWQSALFVLMVIILASPVWMIWIAHDAHRHHHTTNTTGIGHVVTEMYHSNAYWFEGVRLGWRLSLGLIDTFTTTNSTSSSSGDVVRLIAGLCVNLLYLTLHITVQPFKDLWANRLNMLSVVCLLLIGGCYLPLATVLQSASAAMDGGGSAVSSAASAFQSLLRSLSNLAFVLLLLPILVPFVFAAISGFRRCTKKLCRK